MFHKRLPIILNEIREGDLTARLKLVPELFLMVSGASESDVIAVYSAVDVLLLLEEDEKNRSLYEKLKMSAVKRMQAICLENSGYEDEATAQKFSAVIGRNILAIDKKMLSEVEYLHNNTT